MVVGGNVERYVRSCPECIIATGTRPPLHPIPVQRPFQILGIDVMDLPVTKLGNRHVVVIQDLFTKWPLVFPVPDQKASRIARLIAEEVVPFFGVPESLLSTTTTCWMPETSPRSTLVTSSIYHLSLSNPPSLSAP